MKPETIEVIRNAIKALSEPESCTPATKYTLAQQLKSIIDNNK
jgi:hypothetical protein